MWRLIITLLATISVCSCATSTPPGKTYASRKTALENYTNDEIRFFCPFISSHSIDECIDTLSGYKSDQTEKLEYEQHLNSLNTLRTESFMAAEANRAAIRIAREEKIRQLEKLYGMKFGGGFMQAYYSAKWTYQPLRSEAFYELNAPFQIFFCAAGICRAEHSSPKGKLIVDFIEHSDDYEGKIVFREKVQILPSTSYRQLLRRLQPGDTATLAE